MSTSGTRPPQRRGLGRGLGSLIPTGPTTGVATDPASSGPGSDADGDSPGGCSAVPAGRHDVPPSRLGRPGAGREESSDDRHGLGGLAPVEGAYFAEIPVDQVRPNHAQPRQVFDEDAMAELVHSVQEIGVLQPIVVRRRGDASFELVMGERRWRATREAGLATVPAIVRETDDLDMLRDALLENLHRSDLNALEEAAAYQQLLDDFGCTHEELATRIGRSRPQISNTLRLLRLSAAVQRRVAAGVLSAGHARALLAVDDPDLQDRLAQRVVAEGISVRGLEEIVAVRDDRSPAPRTTRRRSAAPGLTDLADRLSDRFETRVKVDLGRSKGKITVEFATMDDLQRIIDIMDPRNRTDRPI